MTIKYSVTECQTVYKKGIAQAVPQEIQNSA
jgi:hypothetical protein